ncbi:MAG: hypothetical protein IKP47_06180 [Ruminococcus sp.]|nr:hypothetical protein [Ruminococcus sp.]
MQRIKHCAAAAAVLLIMTGLIVYGRETSEAAVTAIKRCVYVIVPSLFAFMAFSNLMISTGAAGYISRLTDMPFRILLGIPKGTSALFLISNIAGYPVGASMLSETVSTGRLDKRSAEVMSIYCYAAGPAFIINTVGLGIFGRTSAGTAILFSVISTNLVLAAAVNRIYKPGSASIPAAKPDAAASLTGAVAKAGEAMIKMCGIIILFSAVTAMFQAFAGDKLPSGSARVFLLSALEITNLTSLKDISGAALPITAVTVGFGGVSVIAQLMSAAGRNYSLNLFLKWLPVRAGLNFGFAKLYCSLMPEVSIPAFAQTSQIIVEIDNFIPSICLIMMIFLIVFKKTLDF